LTWKRPGVAAECSLSGSAAFYVVAGEGGRVDLPHLGRVRFSSPFRLSAQELMSDMVNIRWLRRAIGPLIAAALLVFWAYWTSLTGVAHP
jgi:hypothetical protein